MKKSIAITWIFLFTILLTSCGKPNYPPILTKEPANTPAPPEFTYTHSDDVPLEFQNNTNAHYGFYDNHLYFKSKSVLYKIDPRTGIKTTVCPDPVCTHEDESCKLFSISSAFCVKDGVFYFDKLVISGTGTEESISSFDFLSTELKSLYDRTECSRQYVRMMVYDGYIYFYRSYFKEEEEKSPEDKIFISDLVGVNLKNGKMIDIILYNDSVRDDLIGCEDGYIYLCEPRGGIFRVKAGTVLPEKEYIYSFEENNLSSFYPDRMALSDGYIYYHTTDEDGTSFWKIPTSGGEPERLAADSTIKADYCYYTENFIYYSAVSQKIIGKNHGEDLYCDVYDIRRVSYDGVIEKVFCEFPEGYETYSLSGNYIVVGNYIYTHTYDWGELKEIYSDSDCRYDEGHIGAVARINIQTGEVDYIGWY